MKYYPIFLRVAQRSCLIVGGGKVAQQKALSLLGAGAAVTVISPELTAELQALAANGRITHLARPYAPRDVCGYVLAYAATGDPVVDRHIVRDAEDAGVLVNVVDQPDLCDFIAPAVMRRGDLLIATSTSGASPTLAKRIRQDLEAQFGEEYAEVLLVLRRVRQRLKAAGCAAVERQRIFAALVESPLPELLRQRKHADVDQLLAVTVGRGVSLASLGVVSG